MLLGSSQNQRAGELVSRVEIEGTWIEKKCNRLSGVVTDYIVYD